MQNFKKYDYFELMDRCYIQLAFLEHSLSGHQGLNPEMEYKIDTAINAVNDVYQWAGQKLDELEDE